MNNFSDHACLSLAKSSFEEALIVISKLESQNNEENSEEKDRSFRRRAIILCRGRCLANLGKTFSEQANSLTNSKLITGSNQHAQRLLRQALKCFRSAELDAQALRAQAIVDAPFDKRTIEQKLDADKLEYFTNHLQAYAFLSLGRIDHCISCIQKAAGINDDKSASDLPKFLVEDSTNISLSKLHLMEDLYEAAFSAISIISVLLQEKYNAMQSSKNKDTDDLFSILCKAYDQAATLSTTIFHCPKEELREIVDMITSKEEMYTKKEIEEFKTLDIDRHNNRILNKKVTKNEISIDKGRRRSLPLPRNDIFRDTITLSRREPSGKFIIDDSMSFTKDSEKKTGLAAKNTKNSQIHNDLDKFFSEDIETINELDECDHYSITYLKWGNELFEEQGLILNVYPNCEPPRPPEMSLKGQG